MKVYIQDNETDPSVIIQQDADPAPNGYTETTDIVVIDRYWRLSLQVSVSGWRDRKNVRDKLKGLIYTKMGVAVPADVEDDAKFALLTTAEQSIALHWFILGKESWQLDVVNDDAYWVMKAQEYREWTMEVRKKRVSCMEALVFRRMKYLEEAKDILMDMNQILVGTPIPLDANDKTTSKVRTRPLKETFVDGIEGTLEDNAGSFVFESLSDWIDSRANTAFQNNGMRNCPHTFRGSHTADTVADELLAIKEGTW